MGSANAFQNLPHRHPRPGRGHPERLQVDRSEPEGRHVDPGWVRRCGSTHADLAIADSRVGEADQRHSHPTRCRAERDLGCHQADALQRQGHVWRRLVPVQAGGRHAQERPQAARPQAADVACIRPQRWVLTTEDTRYTRTRRFLTTKTRRHQDTKIPNLGVLVSWWFKLSASSIEVVLAAREAISIRRPLYIVLTDSSR